MTPVETLREAARLMRTNHAGDGTYDGETLIAVADWLEDAAEHQVVHEQIVAAHVQGTGQVIPPGQPRILASAVTVARAYLGEQS